MAQVCAAKNELAATVTARQATGRTPTAAQRVLAMPELVDLIVDHVPLTPRTPLPGLNRAFRTSCSRPQVWAARTAPSTIDWTHHTVHTERCMMLLKAATSQSPITWHHERNTWRLHCARRAPTADEGPKLDWVWYQSRVRMRPYLAAHPLSQSLWCTPNGLPLYLEDNRVRQCVTLSFLEQRWERKQAQVTLCEPALCSWWALSEVTHKLTGTFVVPTIAGGLIGQHCRQGVNATWVALEALACCAWLLFGLSEVRAEYQRFFATQARFEELTDFLGRMPQVAPASFGAANTFSLPPPQPDEERMDGSF